MSSIYFVGVLAIAQKPSHNTQQRPLNSLEDHEIAETHKAI
jgi:hypothetical protein